jgi:hypothetical protein
MICNELIFGTDGAISAGLTGVVIESLNGDSNLQYKAEAKNKEGSTIAVVAGKRTGTVTVSGYLNKDGTTPSVNDNFTMDNLFCIVEKVTIRQSNTDFQKVEVTAKFWEGVDSLCND